MNREYIILPPSIRKCIMSQVTSVAIGFSIAEPYNVIMFYYRRGSHFIRGAKDLKCPNIDGAMISIEY